MKPITKRSLIAQYRVRLDEIASQFEEDVTNAVNTKAITERRAHDLLTFQVKNLKSRAARARKRRAQK